jgi:hypothetical protein
MSRWGSGSRLPSTAEINTYLGPQLSKNLDTVHAVRTCGDVD